MIRTDNDIFFMTAGDACYIMKNDGGALKTLYFGKRVEPEDDISALCGKPFDEFCGDDLVLTRGGKPMTVKLEFSGYEVLDDKPTYGPTLSGGKTLKVTLSDGKNAVRVELLYTPYPLGGFTRRVVVINDGADVTVKSIKQRFIPTTGGEAVYAGSERNNTKLNNFIATMRRTSAEYCAETFGFLCVYRDGVMTADRASDVTVTATDLVRETLAQNAACASSEALAVYSDGGLGGMTRVFHDILRETFAGSASARTPTVLFCPTFSEKKIGDAVRAACELGCDVIAFDGGEITPAALKAATEACAEVGLGAGLFLPATGIKKSSVLYADAYADCGGRYALDYADPAARTAYVEKCSAVASSYGVRYVIAELPDDVDRHAASTVFELFGRLRGVSPDIKTEWGIMRSGSFGGSALCYPPCVMRVAIELEPADNLKERFDVATFGLLGYRLDPLAVGEVRHAVRAQILSYQDDAPTVLRGDLFRSSTVGANCRTAVAKDKSRAYSVCELVTDIAAEDNVRLPLVGLDERNLYLVREMKKTFSGAALVRYGVPVSGRAGDTVCLHLRQVADFE